MRKLIRNCALILAVCMSSNAYAQTNLFEHVQIKLSEEQQSIVNNCRELETTKRVAIVKVRHKALSQNFIRLNFFGDFKPVVDKTDIGYTGIQFPSWTGTEYGTLGSVSIVINDNRLSGHFTSIYGNYEVAPLGNDGIHMVFENDNEKFRQCYNDGVKSQEKDIKNEKPSKNIDDNTIPISEPSYNDQEKNVNPNSQGNSDKMIGNECFIRLILAYTPGAKTNTFGSYGRTMNEHLALAVLDQNNSYANSAVEQRCELAYSYQTTQNETSSHTTDIINLQGMGDGTWDEIHTHRDNYDGDMCALITDGTYGSICGRAYGFSYTDPTFFFNLSEYQCIVGNYTLAHEFGHCQGLRHDNDPNVVPFSYAHGYNQGSIFRTIMAVCCTPARVGYWSNPLVTYPGGGGAMGVALSQDNALALDAGDGFVASHRTTPNIFTTTIALGSDVTLNMVAIDSLYSTNTAPSGAELELKSQGSVILEPGFHAMSGADARIHIIPACTASYSRLAPEQPIVESDNNSLLKRNSMDVYPNPANESTRIDLRLIKDANVVLKIVDVNGKIVDQLRRGAFMYAGLHQYDIDLSSYDQGLYFVQMSSDKEVISKKILINK